MSDAVTVILISSAISLLIALVGIIGTRMGKREDREDKSRDGLQERVEQAESKSEQTTTKLYEALEAGRQALLKSDGNCKEQINAQARQIEQLKRDLDNLRDFMTAYIRAVRNNVPPDVMIKIRDELDNAGVDWPRRG